MTTSGTSGSAPPFSRVVVTGATGYVGGRVGWYGIYPLHSIIFSDLVEAVARDAEELAGEAGVRAPDGRG